MTSMMAAPERDLSSLSAAALAASEATSEAAPPVEASLTLDTETRS